MSQSVSLLLAVPAELNPEGVQIRTAGTNDNPLFCLADVCRVLGVANSRDVAARIPADEKGVANADTLGGKQELVFISEAGLYRVLLTSRVEKAEPFKRWVCGEVLPSIRKFGCYPPPPDGDPRHDPIIRNCRDIIELRTAQLEFELRLRQTEEAVVNVGRLAKAAFHTANGNLGHFSVLGFARLRGMEMPRTLAAAHGKALAALCRQLGEEIGKVSDPRFGQVNTYPESVLQQYFEEATKDN